MFLGYIEEQIFSNQIHCYETIENINRIVNCNCYNDLVYAFSAVCSFTYY